MTKKEFINISQKILEKWLNDLNRLIRQGNLSFPGTYSFNNILRIAESPSHYICELMGAKQHSPYENISIACPNRPERIKNTNSYFIPFSKQDNASATVRIIADDITLSGLRLTTDFDFHLVKEKINFALPDNLIDRKKAETPLLINSSVKTFILNDITLIKTDSLRLIYRYIPTAIIINKNMDLDTYHKWLQTKLKQLPLVSIPGSHDFSMAYIIGININLDSEVEEFSRQLLSLSTQQIHETRIDSFLQENKRLFVESLGYIDCLVQPKLNWIVRKDGDPCESIPDYLMKNATGTYDILDLKTGAIKYQSLTKGKKTKNGGFVRVRFNDYVSELISQLKDYERYFSYTENHRWAIVNNEIRIDPDKVKLIGIVGNYNNFDRIQVSKALMAYDKRITILSYNDLVNLMREAASVKTGSQTTRSSFLTALAKIKKCPTKPINADA